MQQDADIEGRFNEPLFKKENDFAQKMVID